MSQQQTPPTAMQIAATRVNDLNVAINDNYFQSQLKAALGDNSAAFAASLIELFSGDKNLMDCDPKHVIIQAMKAAVLKLPIVKSLGYAYIVAFNKVPTFQIGYKGLIQLAIRTGQYKHINAGPVYEGEFRSADKLTGSFDLSGLAKSDTIIGYFAHFELHNGFSKTLYMTKERVTAHAARYSASFNHPRSIWKSEFDAMAVKTVLRNLLNHYGFLTVEMANAFEDDDTVKEEIDNNANKEKIGFAKPIEVTANETYPGDGGLGF